VGGGDLKATHIEILKKGPPPTQNLTGKGGKNFWDNFYKCFRKNFEFGEKRQFFEDF